MFHTIPNTWSHTVKATYVDLADEVVWDIFKEAFTNKFIPDHVWIQKLTKLKQLT